MVTNNNRIIWCRQSHANRAASLRKYGFLVLKVTLFCWFQMDAGTGRFN